MWSWLVVGNYCLLSQRCVTTEQCFFIQLFWWLRFQCTSLDAKQFLMNTEWKTHNHRSISLSFFNMLQVYILRLMKVVADINKCIFMDYIWAFCSQKYNVLFCNTFNYFKFNCCLQLALSDLQSKAEKEISKAQKLISDKDAELVAAEESLSELVEVLLVNLFELNKSDYHWKLGSASDNLGIWQGLPQSANYAILKSSVMSSTEWNKYILDKELTIWNEHYLLLWLMYQYDVNMEV